jgi:molybdopterin converting factor small subunit
LKFLAEKDKTVEKIKEYLLFSINKKQASLKDKINDGDEIAIFVTPTGG